MMFDHRGRHHGKVLAALSENREDPRHRSSSKHQPMTNSHKASKAGRTSLGTMPDPKLLHNNALIPNETEGVDKLPVC